MSLHDREKLKLLQLVRRLRGQLDAVERLVNTDDDCGGQLMLLVAVRGGVNGLMGEIMETHIRFHLVDGATEQIAPELAEDLIDLVLGLISSRVRIRPGRANASCSQFRCHPC